MCSSDFVLRASCIVPDISHVCYDLWHYGAIFFNIFEGRERRLSLNTFVLVVLRVCSEGIA